MTYVGFSRAKPGEIVDGKPARREDPPTGWEVIVEQVMFAPTAKIAEVVGNLPATPKTQVSHTEYRFIFDRATLTGTVSGGDLGWGDPKAFTRGLLDEALRSTQKLAAQVKGSDARSKLPVIDAALALGRVTGLTARTRSSGCGRA